jgi:hypothetical protein
VHTVKPGFVETEGFPQRGLPARVRPFVVSPNAIAEHIVDSVERGRGETTVPRYYGVGGVLQAGFPNLLADLLVRFRIER